MNIVPRITVSRTPNAMPIRQGIRGPRTVQTIVSAIPDAVYPWDPAVVRAIRREFDPNFVPLYIKKVYRTPAGVEFIEQYHALGAHDPDKRSHIAPWVYSTLMPALQACRKNPRPTRIHLHLFHRDERSGRPIPGTFVPFDWLVFKGLISMRDEMRAEERRLWLEDHSKQKETAKAREKAEERAEYESIADERYVGRQVEAFDIDDWKRMRSGRGDARPTRPSVEIRRPTHSQETTQ